jgi:hypothetical protein
MKMALTRKWLIALLSIAAASGGEKEKAPFKPGPVESYPFRQTIQGVTIAAAPFYSQPDVGEAFGKLDPTRYGVLPILIVIRNGSDKAIALDKLKLEFVTPDRESIEPTPANEVRYIRGARRPDAVTIPIPGMPPRVSRKKNPLDAWEIEGRAFAARMLPPKESASGFFYFQAFYRTGCELFLRGLREAATGQELFYFEIPLDKQTSDLPVRYPTHEPTIRQGPPAQPRPGPIPAA